jgi:hypothetical protein
VRAARDLHDVLDNPPGQAALPEVDLRRKLANLQQTAEILQDQLNELRRPVENKTQNLLRAESEQPEATPSVYARIDAVLATPFLKMEDRRALWKAGRALSHRLHEKTIELDHVREEPQKSLTPEHQPGGGSDDVEEECAARRARLAIALLQLGGLADAKQLEQDLEQILRTPSEAAWHSLAGKLRQAWARQVPNQFKELVKEGLWADADRLSRIMPLSDKDGRARPGDAGSNPRAELNRRNARAAWQWLAKRYRDESTHFPNSSVYAEFYARAADEYLRFSR